MREPWKIPASYGCAAAPRARRVRACVSDATVAPRAAIKPMNVKRPIKART